MSALALELATVSRDAIGETKNKRLENVHAEDHIRYAIRTIRGASHGIQKPFFLFFLENIQTQSYLQAQSAKIPLVCQV
jgi:hypothetical protein